MTQGFVNTNNITLPLAVGQGGTGVTTSTGTGSVVLNNSPVIAQINDTAGNAAVKFVSSGITNINQLTILTAPTGFSPEISATGSDSNIGLFLRTKGTGTFSLVSGSGTAIATLYNGTSNQHITNITAPNTSATRTIALPDTDISCFVVQRVSTQTGAVATGTTIMPYDDTIPQNTEGNEYMSLAITPKSTANILEIQITFTYMGSVGTNTMVVALFQDSTANAIAAAPFVNTTTFPRTVTFTYSMAAGTTSATTFKVRAGMDAAGTTTFNGSGGARRLGGVGASSIRITEYSS